MSFLDILVLYVFLLFGASNCQIDSRLTRTDFLTLLNEMPLDRTPPNYDSDEPTMIFCYLNVNNVDTIREADMDFTVDIELHLSWKNTDLISKIRTVQHADFKYLDFDAQNMEKVWVPDIYFPNEKKAAVHNIMMVNKMLRLYKDSTVRYIVRVSVTLSCRMDLRKYPFDKQICSIMIESFGYNVDKLLLQWDEDEEHPVVTDDLQELRQFRMVNLEIKNFTRTHNITGNHSCLQADFHLVRNVGFYVIQMYVPSLLIVMLSWLSFWLNVNSIPGRVTLGVLSVLTISTQSSGVNASLPRVSYTKAIDVWMATCLVFAFAALIEFAVVNVLSQKVPGRRFSLANIFLLQKEEEQEDRDCEDATECALHLERKKAIAFLCLMVVDQDGKVSIHNGQQSQSNDTGRQSKSHIILCSVYLDVASRFMFPLAFGIFNMIYWIYYLNVIDY